MAICKYTKEDEEGKIFFTMLNPFNNHHAGKIAELYGGGGSKDFSGWNMDLKLADQWLFALGSLERGGGFSLEAIEPM